MNINKVITKGIQTETNVELAVRCLHILLKIDVQSIDS